MNYRWSVEKTMKFIEAFEKHKCLWDVKDKSYKNRESRYKAYSDIAKAMNLRDFGVLDVRTKIRSLRNAYTLELAKIHKSKRPGADAEQIHKPRVPWFRIADRVFGNGSNTSGSDIRLRSSDDKNLTNLLRMRKREEYDDDFTDFGSITPSVIQDEFDIFGAFVASELRGLENHKALRRLKRKIQIAILEAYEPINKPCQSPAISASSSAHQRSSEIETRDSVNIITETRSDEGLV